MSNQVNSCLLCGVGGQGTILASKLIANGAMKRGLQVRTAETIGMAQRGGCVVSHLRMGKQVYSSMIPKHSADIMIAFEPGEAVRCLSYLKPDGYVVVSSKAVQPVTSILAQDSYQGEAMIAYLKNKVKHLIVVDTEEVFAQCGSAKVLNTALLGAAAKSGALGLSVDEIKEAMISKVPEKFHELNHKAIDIGASLTA